MYFQYYNPEKREESENANEQRDQLQGGNPPTIVCVPANGEGMVVGVVVHNTTSPAMYWVHRNATAGWLVYVVRIIHYRERRYVLEFKVLEYEY